MSGPVFTISQAGPEKEQLTVARYSGGPKFGACVMVSQHTCGYIRFTRTDWRILRAVIDAQFQEDAK